MVTLPQFLLDNSSAKVADLEVTRAGDHFNGTIRLDAAPPHLKRLFEAFEEMVEGQVYTAADEIEDELAKAELRVEFADGTEAAVEDLQVFPTTGRVSFKVRQLSPAR